MISVLIPIYNYNTFPLVAELYKQCTACNTAFEIICFDDGSSLYVEDNKKIAGLSCCRLERLPANVGRSRIRNKLVKAAKYNRLLFIDCDSRIIANSFISQYIENMNENDIVYGGRIHSEKPPSGRKILRWKYGKYREDRSAAQRNKQPYESVLFNNTLLKKESFERIQFDQSITQYGHEDTLSAYKAKQLKYRVKHIDNPVEHADIDDNEAYIDKTKRALDNLKRLYKTHKIDPGFIKLLYVYHRIRTFGIHVLLAFFHTLFRNLMYRNLSAEKASLFVFNLYRLSYFCLINQQK